MQSYIAGLINMEILELSASTEEGGREDFGRDDGKMEGLEHTRQSVSPGFEEITARETEKIPDAYFSTIRWMVPLTLPSLRSIVSGGSVKIWFCLME